MRKIIAICVIAIVLCNIMSVFAYAQNTNKSITDKNILTSADISKLSVDQRQILVEQAFADRLSGKTDKLIVPGFTNFTKIYSGHPVGMPLPPRPNTENAIAIGYAYPTSSTGGITPLVVTSGLPIVPQISTVSDQYSNTYFQFGGYDNVLPDKTKAALSGSAVIDTSTLNNMITSPAYEMLVLHMWGDGRYHNGGEDDIVIAKNQTVPNTIDFTVYIGQFYPTNWTTTIPIPVGHRVAIYIMAVPPTSGAYYQTLEYDIYDLTAGHGFNQDYTLSQPQMACKADITLEHSYPQGVYGATGLNLVRTATNFHAYDQYNNVMNLLQTGLIVDMASYNPPDYLTNLRCHNGYSYQLTDYFTANGQGLFNAWIY